MQAHKSLIFFLVILELFHQSAAKPQLRIDSLANFNETLTIKYGSECLLEAARFYFYLKTRENLQTIVVSHIDHLTSPADMIQDTFLKVLNEELVTDQDFHR